MKDYFRITYKKYALFLTLMLLLGGTKVYSQDLVWETSYPKMHPEVIGTYGAPGELEIQFTVTDNVPNAKLEVVLPTGIKYKNFSLGAGNQAGSFTVAQNGSTVTFTPSAALPKDKLVSINVEVTAEMCDEKALNLDVRLLNGTKVIGSKKAILDVKQPTVRVQTDASMVEGAVGDILDFALKLDVPNGLLASSIELKLHKDTYTTISDFKLDGVAVTTVTNGAEDVTIKLDNIDLGVATKKLTFKAVANVGSPRNITVAGTYHTPVCNEFHGPTLTLKYPTIPGTANYDKPTARWVAKADMDKAVGLAHNTEIIMNGVDYSYLRLEYLNSGNAGVVQTKASLQARRSVPYDFGYIDINNIYYSLDNGTTKTKVLPSEIKISRSLIKDNGYILMKDVNVGKPDFVEITINELVRERTKLVVYWPVIQGAIYDNETYHPRISAGAHPYSSLQFDMYNILGTGPNGEAVGVPSNTYGEGGIAIPKFISSFVPLDFRKGQKNTATVNVDIGKNVKADEQTTDLVVKLPSWIELDGEMKEAIVVTGGKLEEGYPKVEANNVYRYRYVNTIIDQLTVKYKAKDDACSGQNLNDTIEYWMDYNLGGSNLAIRPVLKKIAKVYQPVVFLCEEDGIKIEDFSLYRITRGLRDNDENYIPDDGQPADDANILHNTYLKNDEGKIKIKQTVIGGPYQNMYLLLSSSFKMLPKTIELGTPTITIDGVKENVTLTKKQDSLYYISYNKNLVNGKTMDIEIPYKMIEANNLTKIFTIESYVANSVVTDPFNPGAARIGKDKMSEPFIVHAEAFARDRSAEKIDDNEVFESFTISYIDTYHGNSFYKPYFVNEIRRIGELLNLRVELPEGYRFTTDSLTMENRSLRDSVAVAQPKLKAPLTSKETLISGATIYNYDISYPFVKDVNTQTQANALKNKWMHPDEIFNYIFYVPLQATKGAPPTGVVKSSVTYHNNVDDSTYVRDHNFGINYTGDKNALLVEPQEIMASRDTLSVPLVRINNPNGYPLDSWIYVKGKIKSAAVVDKNGVRIEGEGKEGRWIHLGDIPEKKFSDYELLIVNTNPDCVNDTITVYTASKFNTAWVPNTNAPIDPDDIDHVAASKSVVVIPSITVLNGAITLGSTTLTFNTPYTVNPVIDSKSSEGDIHKGEMLITIPAGQEYVPGGTYEYPKGTPLQALPATVESALVALNGNLSLEREFHFAVKDFIATDILPGFSGAPAYITDADRELTLHLEFSPQCETVLTGINFLGALNGESGCGNPSEGENLTIHSEKMFAHVTTTYEFEVVPVILSGNQAFNEIRNEDKLEVKVKKIVGNGAIGANDALAISIPKWMDISNITISSTDIPTITGAINIVHDTLIHNVRVLRLEFPITELNGSTDNGLQKTFTYLMDLKYPKTKNDTVVATPIHQIEAQVLTIGSLDISCDNSFVTIGDGVIDVALVTANHNKFVASIGNDNAITIISNGYKGIWYDLAIAGTQLSDSATYIYTPSVTGTDTVYVSSVFNNVNYGRVPVVIETRPALDFDVISPTFACPGSIVNLRDLVSGLSNGMSLKFYSDSTATTEVIPNQQPTSDTVFYAQASNGVIKSVVKKIEIKAAVTPTMQVSAVNTTECYNQPVKFNIALTGVAPWTIVYSDGIKNDTITVNTNNYVLSLNASKTTSYKFIDVQDAHCSDVVDKTITVTITDKPVITKQSPIRGVFCENQEFSLFVETTGGVTGYQWFKNNVAIPGATTAKYIVNDNASVADKGHYRVDVYGGCADTISSDLIIIQEYELIAITQQLLARTVCELDPLTLEVRTTGSVLNYQWYKNGVKIEGATDSIYALSRTTLADAGEYHVVVVGACNNDELVSSKVIVTVNEIVRISAQPENTVFCEGQPLELTIETTGPATVTYQWYKDDVAIPGATSKTYRVASATHAEAGVYRVTITNTQCTNNVVSSRRITVGETELISIQEHPYDASVCEDWYLVLSVEATGSIESYQWFKDGAPIQSATTNRYYKRDLKVEDGGVYHVEIKGNCGDVVSSDKANVKVNRNVSVTEQSLDAVYCAGEPLELFVTATGDVTNIQWYKDGQLITGARGAKLLLTNTTAATAGDYYAIIYGECNDARQSGKITVTPAAALQITTQPANITACISSPGTLSVVATGNILSYQWYKDNAPISGATSSTYSANEAGSYKVDVIGACGTLTSTAVTVTLSEPLAITSQTGSAEICEGDAGQVELVVEVTGTVDTYQWYFKGAPISGATSNTYVIPSATQANAGAYYVIATGLCNSVRADINVSLGFNPTDIIVQKWNNTLVANNNDLTNGGFKFVSYKWFKEDKLIGTNPYYSAGQSANNLLDMNANYYLEVTTTDGRTFKTCAYRPVMKSETGIRVYPNPVSANGTVTIEAKNLDKDLLSKSTVEVYNASGTKVSTKEADGRLITVTMPSNSGIYILKFKSTEFEEDFKIIVQ